MRSGSGRISLTRHRFKGQWQDYREAAAVAGGALHIDVAAVTFDDFV